LKVESAVIANRFPGEAIPWVTGGNNGDSMASPAIASPFAKAMEDKSRNVRSQ